MWLAKRVASLSSELHGVESSSEAVRCCCGLRGFGCVYLDNDKVAVQGLYTPVACGRNQIDWRHGAGAQP